MKHRFAVLLSSIFFSIPLFAQSVADIRHDAKLGELFREYKAYNKDRQFGEGYRIQIMYTNVREEAYAVKGNMYRDFPELKTYVEYEQPYFKLRVGDFNSRLDATYYFERILALYPGSFIVKTRIRIKNS